MPASSDDLALALELADMSDEIALAWYRSDDLAVETKADLTPVTEADTEVERVIRGRLEAERPGDSIVGEEYGVSTAPDSLRRWILDPIDGTKNYVSGIPVWATLLALQDADELSVAVVSAPALRRRWWAARGTGAFMDDGFSDAARRLGVSTVSILADAQLSLTGLKEWRELGRLDAVISLIDGCRRTRGFGDFWGYMLVAEGAIDIALDSPGVSLWDLAAMQLIVEEAGGRFTDLAGVRTADGGEAIASNGLVHQQALDIVGRQPPAKIL